MKSRLMSWSAPAMLVAFLAVLCLLPLPAAAQQAQASATGAAKAAMPSTPPPSSPAPLSAEEAAKAAMPSHPAPSAATPMATDGHPDLTGLWWKYRGVNLVVQQVGNTRVRNDRRDAWRSSCRSQFW